ncbi:MAG: hypothetical protein ABIN67_09540 [Ferruginibacter sp.]
MSKQDLFSLIDRDIDEAFIELDKVFLETNARYRDLCEMYANQPNNFSLNSFRSMLKRRVNLDYKDADPMPKQAMQINYYEALCEFDFKTQTKNFKSIHQYKKVAPFLLHGKSDEKENDLKWLCNQILNEKSILGERYKIIDCGSKLGGTFERFLEELYLSFDVNTADTGNKPTAVLIREIEKKLVTGPFVCVIKNAGTILGDKNELKKLFRNLLKVLHENIVTTGQKHAFILLFIDANASGYKNRYDNYFFWFDEATADTYSENAEKCKDIKIFDLSPVGKIEEKHITDWLDWSQENNSALYNQARALRSCKKELLNKGDNPFQVIEQICKNLKINIDNTWIQ